MTQIRMDIPGHVWWRLTAVAERKGQKVDELLTEIVTGIAHPDPVVYLHAQGLTDAEIGNRIGRTLGSVATNRRKAGLKPNKKAGH